MNSRDVIEREYKARELDYILAIQRLEALGWLPDDAEETVNEWEMELINAPAPPPG